MHAHPIDKLFKQLSIVYAVGIKRGNGVVDGGNEGGLVGCLKKQHLARRRVVQCREVPVLRHDEGQMLLEVAACARRVSGAPLPELRLGRAEQDIQIRKCERALANVRAVQRRARFHAWPSIGRVDPVVPKTFERIAIEGHERRPSGEATRLAPPLDMSLHEPLG